MGQEKMDEKQEEKVQEKQVEKHEEKVQQDPLNAVVAALILIWAGVVLLASNLGLLETLTRLMNLLPLPEYGLPFDIPFVGLTAWRLFFLGAGGIVLCEVLVRLDRAPVPAQGLWQHHWRDRAHLARVWQL